MKKIIVTGGLGFIGSNLVRKLSKKYIVIVIDKHSYSSNIINLEGINRERLKFYKFKIENKNKFFNILNKYNPVGIFHLAAETHVDRSIENPQNFINSNVLGTFSILEALKKYAKKDKGIKLIHISTDEVYGDIMKQKTSKENDPYFPSSPYAASKASSDHLVYAYYKTYKLPVIITNCCNNFGPRQFPEKLIPKLIINIINNKDLPIYGKGNNQREWIHVDDHNDALLKIFKKGKIGHKYNIGSGEILSNIQIAKLLLKILKHKLNKINSKIIFVKDRPGHDLRYALNSGKIRKELNWKKKFNIKDGLINTISWYLKNEIWIKKLNKKNYINRLGLKHD